MDKGKILVVDDDAFFRTVCSDMLVSNGYAVKLASKGNEAISLIENEDFDIVITDLIMPDVSGMEVLHRTKQKNTLVDVIVVTGHGSIDTAVEALKNGAFDYIRKPLNQDELFHTVKGCLEKKKLLAENIEMRQSLKLFEVSRTILSTIDMTKLYNISLDALMQIIPADAGIFIFYNSDGKELEIKALRHIGLNEGERVVSALKERFEKDLKGLKTVMVLDRDEFGEGREELKDFGSILLAPVTKGQNLAGFMLALGRNTGYGMRDIKNVTFIAEHASNAFENAQKYTEAKEMAFIDSLTGLYNSKYLEAALDKELKRADRLLTPVTILFLDLDNFKKINDLNDHLVGSKTLVETGKILNKCVREVDTVIRYGGDEFVVILLDADYNVAYRIAERIRSTIENHRFLADENLDVRVTASIGIATYPVHTKDKKELLKIADRAMYRAKDLSRNVVYLAPVPELLKD
jgi:diguanylate cyclase (GGDEF)-like protein